MLDYDFLRVIWWVLICVLLVGFAIFDGFDFGTLLVTKFISRSEEEIRVCYNTIAPHWDGNQVWLLLGGGAIFAAWPIVYATSFSGFYLAMILVLAALYFRPVGLEYRSKLDTQRSRTSIDYLLTFSGLVPPLVIGVAFGNLLLGVPFTFNEFLYPEYGTKGEFFLLNLLKLLNPFAILVGLVSLGMITLQGLTWLQLKTKDALYRRANTLSQYVAIFTLVLFILSAIVVHFVDGYAIVNINTELSDPTKKEVIKSAGAWFTNYNNYPILWLIPTLSIVSLLISLFAIKKHKNAIAFFFSSVNIAAIFFTCASAMFPFIMPSNSNPNYSLTIWDSTATQYTLQVMFIVAVIFVPIILSYTAWAFFKMRGRISNDDIKNNSKSLY